MINKELKCPECQSKEVKKGFFRKIGGVFYSVGTSIGNFFKFIWDKMIFWK